MSGSSGEETKRLHSKSALLAGGLSLAAHLLISPNFASGSNSAEETVASLVTILWASTALLAIAAAFIASPAFRVAALTAAFAATVPPLYPLLLYFVGVFYLPGTITSLIAAIKSARLLSLRAKIGSFASGVLSTAALYATAVHLILSYESCQELGPAPHTGRLVSVSCDGSISSDHLVSAAATYVASLLLLIAAGLMFRGSPTSEAGRHETT